MHPARPISRVLLALGVSLALVAGACSSDAGNDATDASTTTAPDKKPTDPKPTSSSSQPDYGSGAGAEPEVFTEGDFYEVPDPLPDGDHGSLLRYQEVTPSPLDNGTTYRIMYRSESLEGDHIAVTGTAVVPAAPAPGGASGGRPLLTIAHGTTGVADECAPSKDPGGELLLLGDAIDSGWLVAVTDYEGLGTPGRHPYLVGESEGRSTIDAIVAAGALPEADPGDQLAIAGYSQGGHGALWANEVAATWAPDLDVVGTFAGAPATEMKIILAAAPAAFELLLVAGFDAAYPEADPDTILTPLGVEKLPAVDQGCAADVFGALGGITRDDLVKPGAVDAEPWDRLAEENNPGTTKTDGPVLIIHSEADTTVPAALSGILFDRMCGLDQVVERRVLTEGQDHGPAAPGAYAAGLVWLDERFAGDTEPKSSCPPA